MFPSSTRPPSRAVLASALLSALLVSVSVPAAAQFGRDPADITQSGRDPAAVGVGTPRRPTRGSDAAATARLPQAAGEGQRAEAAQPLKADSAEALQTLLFAARDLGDNRYDVNGRQRAGIDALRRDMERVATQVWPHLSPQSQQRYRAALDEIKRLDQLADVDTRDVDAYRARGGALGMLRQTDATIRSLEDALAPMLQDVRSKLQQQADTRYGR